MRKLYWLFCKFTAIRKWEKIIKRVKNKKDFDNSNGWKKLEVVDRCGFCMFFDSCNICPLNKSMISDNMPICRSTFMSRSVFWKFVSEMNRMDPDFNKALEFANLILFNIIKS